MSSDLRPGPATMSGLQWLVGVGPVGMEAWRLAMGWNRSTAYRHAARLISVGWVAREDTVRGKGGLIYATRQGVAVSGVAAAVVAAGPAPTTWAHCDACGWVAAWLSCRGREMLGPRQLLADDRWLGQLRWTERGGARSRGHRPDLVAQLRDEGSSFPIEVELATKSVARLRSVLSLYARWIHRGQARAVIYVCGSEHLADRVTKHAGEVGLSSRADNLRVELLETVVAETTAARASDRQREGRAAA
jgi:hypothetical protein